MKVKIIELIRRALGTKQISERLDQIETRMKSILVTDSSTAEISSATKLEILPGTEYSRYAIPVDYPPLEPLLHVTAIHMKR